MNSAIWCKKTVNLTISERDRLDSAAKSKGYKNSHQAMRTMIEALLTDAENPTSA